MTPNAAFLGLGFVVGATVVMLIVALLVFSRDGKRQSAAEEINGRR